MSPTQNSFNFLLSPDSSSLVSHIEKENLTEEQIIDLLNERSVSPLNFLDCLLSTFVNANFLGGIPHSVDAELTEAKEAVFIHLDAKAVDELSCEGVAPFDHAKFIGLLWLCKTLSHFLLKGKPVVFDYCLYYLKCIYLHQYLFSPERSPTLLGQLQSTIELCDEMSSQGIHIDSQDLICFYMITAYLSAFYYQFEPASKIIDKCATLLNIDVRFGGALGKITRYQQEPTANLIVKISRPGQEELKLSTSDTQEEETHALPQIVTLTDDVLLNSVLFTDDCEARTPILNATEQAFVLLLCELHNLSNPRDTLTTDQRLAYVNTILHQLYPDFVNPSKEEGEAGDSHRHASVGQKHGSWPIASEALYHRSILECTSFRRAERSLSQLEELSYQFTRPDPALAKRGLDDFFFTRMPAIWTVQLEQANLLMKIEAVKSALDIYLRWDQWSNILDCYTRLGKREKIVELINARIAAGQETPELHCVLGDASKDRSHYWKAWELSNKKSSRAMRSLALIHMYIDKDNEKAIECFEKSLELNFMQVSAQVGSFQETIRAYNRLLDLRTKHTTVDVLRALAKPFLNKTDSDPSTTTCDQPDLRSNVLKLFGRVTAADPSSSDVWFLYGQLLLDNPPNLPTYQRAVKCLQSSHQCLVGSHNVGWESSSDKRQCVIDSLTVWLDALLLPVDKIPDTSSSDLIGQRAFIASSLASLRLAANAVQSKIRIAIEQCIDDDSVKLLNEDLQRVNTLLQSVLDRLNSSECR